MPTDKSARAIPTIEPKLNEPWVELANGNNLADWNHDDEIIRNQIIRQKAKVWFFRQTFEFFTGNQLVGDYYEFGCHRCRTFRMALTEARYHNLSDMRFYAFDSFEGLPEPTSSPHINIWQKGALKTSIEDFRSMIVQHGIYVDNTEIIKGFYNDILTPDLQQKMLATGRRIAVATVDCDLYESAVPVLKFIEPLLQEGSVIYMDDLFGGYKGNPTKGVARAFLEWQSFSKWKVVRHLDVGMYGRSYICYKPEISLCGVV